MGEENHAKIMFNLNGKDVSVDTNPIRRLLDVLREDFKLMGTKEGCGEGECGACTVLMNGRAVLSCLITVGSVEGKTIETIESFSQDESPYQEIITSYEKEGACQCGFCIPGFVVSTADYIRNNTKARYTEGHEPFSENSIKRALSGNLCRCTGYENILKAVTQLSNYTITEGGGND